MVAAKLHLQTFIYVQYQTGDANDGLLEAVSASLTVWSPQRLYIKYISTYLIWYYMQRGLLNFEDSTRYLNLC